jgi:phosphoglycerate dehydrogenase-like enzyme
MKAALPAYARPHVEGRLPADLEVRWYGQSTEAPAAVAGAEIGWLDIFGPPGIGGVIEAGADLKWVSTALAGVNAFPLTRMDERGLILTNGAGVNAVPVAEFAVLGVLALAKDLRALIGHQDRREWVSEVPGVGELYGSKALIIGHGAIGVGIGKRLDSFGVELTYVRRSPSGEANVIGPDDWRGRLGEFDWIILAVAATDETRGMIGSGELARMKPSAFIVNIARGTLIDQPALIEAVKARRLAGAFLDVTDPEPPPNDDPIWSTPGIVMTCHSSGRATTRMAQRASDLFLDNLARYRTGQPMRNLVDLGLGY